jgi:hypothetical protein
MAANQVILSVDDPADLVVAANQAQFLIDCHAEAAAELVLHETDNVFQFEIAQLLRGLKGEPGDSEMRWASTNF